MSPQLLPRLHPRRTPGRAAARRPPTGAGGGARAGRGGPICELRAAAALALGKIFFCFREWRVFPA